MHIIIKVCKPISPACRATEYDMHNLMNVCSNMSHIINMHGGGRGHTNCIIFSMTVMQEATHSGGFITAGWWSILL